MSLKVTLTNNVYNNYSNVSLVKKSSNIKFGNLNGNNLEIALRKASIHAYKRHLEELYQFAVNKVLTAMNYS